MNQEHQFISEDRNFGNSTLYVDLVPSSCWFTNIRYCVRPKDWNKIRKIVYSRANYTCEYCKINCIENKIPIEEHERWNFDYSTMTQKLVRLIGLCKDYHLTTHYGFSRINGFEVIKPVKTFDRKNISLQK